MTLNLETNNYVITGIVFFILFCISSYLRFLKLKSEVTLAWSKFDAILEKLYKKLHYLIEVCEEQGIDTNQMAMAINDLIRSLDLSRATGELQMVRRQELKLKAVVNELFAEISRGTVLHDTEFLIQLRFSFSVLLYEITEAKNYYNNAVSAYNGEFNKVPDKVLLRMFSFKMFERYSKKDAKETSSKIKKLF